MVATRTVIDVGINHNFHAITNCVTHCFHKADIFRHRWKSDTQLDRGKPLLQISLGILRTLRRARRNNRACISPNARVAISPYAVQRFAGHFSYKIAQRHVDDIGTGHPHDFDVMPNRTWICAKQCR